MPDADLPSDRLRVTFVGNHFARKGGFVFTALAVMFTRSFVEVDTLSPFTLGLVLFVATGVYARQNAGRQRRAAGAVVPARPMARAA